MIAPTSFFADYGCHVRILEEVRALQNRGHTVRICTYHNGDDVPDIDVRRTVDIPWRRRVVVGSSRHKMYLDAALFALSLREARHFKPDLIHAHLHEGALIGALVGRILRLPVLFDYQGSLTEEMLDHGFLKRQSLQYGLFTRLESFIDGLPDVISPSGDSGTLFLRRRGIDGSRIIALPDAVDTELFNPERVRGKATQVRSRLGIPPDAPVVAYLGLLAEYQGTTLLIEAAREILHRRSDVYFVIAGYPGVGRHAAMAAGMPVSDRVLFPGRIPYDNAPELLAAANVAVAPKLSLTEGNGKVLNYMAMALSVVALDTPPNRAMLGDLGTYAESRCASSLARSIEEALQCPDDRGRKLRQRVQSHFSWDARVEDVERIYQRVLATDASDVSNPLRPNVITDVGNGD